MNITKEYLEGACERIITLKDIYDRVGTDRENLKQWFLERKFWKEFLVMMNAICYVDDHMERGYISSGKEFVLSALNGEQSHIGLPEDVNIEIFHSCSGPRPTFSIHIECTFDKSDYIVNAECTPEEFLQCDSIGPQLEDLLAENAIADLQEEYDRALDELGAAAEKVNQLKEKLYEANRNREKTEDAPIGE